MREDITLGYHTHSDTISVSLPPPHGPGFAAGSGSLPSAVAPWCYSVGFHHQNAPLPAGLAAP